MPKGICPECDAVVHVSEDIDKGECLKCEDCDTSLIVVGLDPIELDLYEETEEEDYYDEYNEYDNT